jgi:kinesin family member 11
MDTQLHSLDDIVTRVREQNNAHHTAHTSSLGALSNTVQSSYSSIGDHLSTSFDRVQALESDVSAQITMLKDTLPALSEEATIRAPLRELRDEITNQNLMEYNPTGQTPAKTAYSIPSTLPRTDMHESLLSQFRDRPISSDGNRSPTKALIFKDTSSSALDESTTDLFASSVMSLSKPNFSRSISANTGHTVHSLRELDVNIVSQDKDTLSLFSPTETGMTVPPLKKQRGADDASKLPMKKMGRKTVTGLAKDGATDRENLTITNFSASVGPGVGAGRKLRSHGSG